MRSTILSVSALLLSFAILSIGHGLQNTVIALRASAENYPTWIIGLMTSFYFLGFLFGAHYGNKAISEVGHIRTFAALASLASGISLLHVLVIDEVFWIACRFIYGFCIASLYLVIESWLNSLSNKKNRAQVLSIYMIISFLFLSIGQSLVGSAKPTEFTLFAVSSILISLALVPLSLSKSQQPEISSGKNFGIKKLFSISPLATTGSFCTGLIIGAFWGLAAIFFIKAGMNVGHAGLALSVSYLGGLALQYTIGYLSDIFDRRLAIMITLLLSSLSCFAIIYFISGFDDLNLFTATLCFSLGAFTHTSYSLFIALLNDFLEPHETVKATGGLISVYAVGAILGPILSSIFMQIFNNSGFIIFIGVINLILATFAFYQYFLGKNIPEATSDSFVSMPRTTAGIVELDPRSN